MVKIKQYIYICIVSIENYLASNIILHNFRPGFVKTT